jgi:hypothetical protein
MNNRKVSETQGAFLCLKQYRWNILSDVFVTYGMIPKF